MVGLSLEGLYRMSLSLEGFVWGGLVVGRVLSDLAFSFERFV